eukprot:comp15007_c0_seq1/m.11619 comp15007_c0_seq1/g.11619  ORF comp15007_c0_seq1/g.11619 comp15007_c0_seq1/m.11619 type:complete len:490 (-) comp15007_c0_seq1:239-1708(-)
MTCSECARLGAAFTQGEDRNELLPELLEHSKRLECREAQGCAGVIEMAQQHAQTLSTSQDPQSHTHLTHSFRLLRNLCAELPEHQERIATPDFCEFLKRQAEGLWKGDHKEENVVPLHALLQLLGNASAGNPIISSVIWNAMFPRTLLALLGRPNNKTFSLTCFLVLNLIAQDSERLQAIVSTEGALLLSEIFARTALTFHPTHQAENGVTPCTLGEIEWARFIIQKIIEFGLIPPAYLRFSKENLPNDPHLSAQKSLGWVLEHEISTAGAINVLDTPAAKGVLVFPMESVMFLVMEVSVTLANSDVDLWQERNTDANSLANIWLPLVSAILSLPTPPENGIVRETVAKQTDLIQNAIAQLRRGWERIPIVKPRTQADVGGDNINSSGELKRELVRLIGNACYRCAAVQDLVRREDGITLLLNHCQLDASSPHIREWAVLAIRNLCEGNEANQAAVRALERQGVVADTEGMELKVDDATGKIRVANARQ